MRVFYSPPGESGCNYASGMWKSAERWLVLSRITPLENHGVVRMQSAHFVGSIMDYSTDYELGEKLLAPKLIAQDWRDAKKKCRPWELVGSWLQA